MPDLSLREWACVLPLVMMMVWMGMYSQTFLPAVSAQDARILTTIEKGPQASNVNITPVSGGSAHAR
jgi:NADH-quinone oxidoreductase subunit M